MILIFRESESGQERSRAWNEEDWQLRGASCLGPAAEPLVPEPIVPGNCGNGGAVCSTLPEHEMRKISRYAALVVWANNRRRNCGTGSSGSGKTSGWN